MSSSLFVVGLGPGGQELLAPQVLAALESSRVIVGYNRYVDLISPEILAGRKVIRSGMLDEMGRCQAAIDAARAGENVSLVCSGDPGVYALAGLVYELFEKRALNLDNIEEPDIRVVPGIPALCAAAALLGAPLMHDFAVISLSDLLTPWELIEKRVVHALSGDFVLVIYNPRSRKRDWQLGAVLEKALAARGENGVIGMVRNAWREGQRVTVSRLGSFEPSGADMLSILIVGNSQTRIMADRKGGEDWERGARMITPRGYLEKYL